MAATVRGRGLDITKNDMDASRLVFVYVRDSKPRRKVAVPVPDSYTWDDFLKQVQTKLKLTGIGDIYLSSSGHKVRSVSELQDIDELCVVEAPVTTIHANGTAAAVAAEPQRQAPDVARQGSLQDNGTPMSSGSSFRQQAAPTERHKVVIADGMAPSTSGASYIGGEDDDERKYTRRAHPFKRSLQRLFPGLFAPGLPVTVRDTQAESGDGGGSGIKLRRKRSVARRSPYTVQNLLVVLVVMSCIGTMVFYFLKLQPGAPLTPAPVPAAHGAERQAATGDTPKP